MFIGCREEQRMMQDGNFEWSKEVMFCVEFLKFGDNLFASRGYIRNSTKIDM